MSLLGRKLMFNDPAASVVIEQTDFPAGVSSVSNIATYSGAIIGAAYTNRIIVVGVVAEDTTSTSPSSATINTTGTDDAMTATTLATDIAGGFRFTRLFYRAVPTGTTATIKITYGAAITASTSRIVIYRVVGANATPSLTGTDGSNDMVGDPLTTGSRTIPARGGFLAVACCGNDTTVKTWNNATEDLDTDAGDMRLTSAIRTTSGTVTITCSSGSSGENGSMAYIIFNPA